MYCTGCGKKLDTINHGYYHNGEETLGFNGIIASCSMCIDKGASIAIAVMVDKRYWVKHDKFFTGKKTPILESLK